MWAFGDIRTLIYFTQFDELFRSLDLCSKRDNYRLEGGSCRKNLEGMCISSPFHDLSAHLFVLKDISIWEKLRKENARISQQYVPVAPSNSPEAKGMRLP